MQQKIQKANRFGTNSTWGGRTSVRDRGSGTASSVAFTPLKGIEIVNPNAADNRVEEALEDGKSSYFSTSASFVKINS